MKDGMFVFDAAVHCQDFSDGQIKDGSDGRRVRILREQLTGFINLTGRRGPPPEPASPSASPLSARVRRLVAPASAISAATSRSR